MMEELESKLVQKQERETLESEIQNTIKFTGRSGWKDYQST